MWRALRLVRPQRFAAERYVSAKRPLATATAAPPTRAQRGWSGHEAYLGGISRTADAVATNEFVKMFGNPRKIVNTRKGYSFVEFNTADEMQSFVEKINGKELCGQRVRAGIAGQKPEVFGEPLARLASLYMPSTLGRLRRPDSAEVVARLAKEYVGLTMAEVAALQRALEAKK